MIDAVLYRQIMADHGEQVNDNQRYQVWLAWQNSSFQAYLEAQQSLGLTRDQALARLKTIWAYEDRQRLEAHRRAARMLSRAR